MRSLRKSQAVRELGERLGLLIRRMEKDAVMRAGWGKDRYVVELDMHSAAPSVMVTLDPEGEISVTGETWRVGPGYHISAIARLDQLIDELDFTWTDELDPESVQPEMAAWFAEQLRAGKRELGVDRAFKVDAPVLTALGPRSDAWRDAVLADPLYAQDAFAWWDPETPAAYSKAVLAMWHAVPWREPLDKDERALMKQVDADLRAARKAAPAIELPWAEWAEMLGNLGHESERVDDIRTRARGAKPSIGYRRYAMEVELSGGWTLDLPGSFVGKWEDDEARYWATDGTRALEFTSMTAKEDHDADQLLAVAPQNYPVIERRSEGAMRGRAEVFDDGDMHVVHCITAVAPHVAILTCKGTVAHEAWALATWRSLHRSE